MKRSHREAIQESARGMGVSEGFLLAAAKFQGEIYAGRKAGRRAADENWPDLSEGVANNLRHHRIVSDMERRYSDLKSPILPWDLCEFAYKAAFRDGYNDRIAECKRIVAAAQREPIPDEVTA